MAQEGASRLEKMPTCIYPDAASASRAVAEEIAQLIRQRQAEGKKVDRLTPGALDPFWSLDP